MRKWLLLLTGLAAPTLVGCMKADQELALNADGSADIKVHYAVSEKALAKALAEVEDFKKKAGPGTTLSISMPVFDEAGIKAAFEEFKGKGAELKNSKVEVKDGWRHVYVETHCADLSVATKVAKTVWGARGAFTLMRKPDGSYVVEVTRAVVANLGEGLPPEEKGKYQEEFKAQWADMRVTCKITVPGDIVGTTAHEKDKRTASWVLDINDDKFFDKAVAMQKQGASVTFDGKGLNLKEVKPEGSDAAESGKPGVDKQPVARPDPPKEPPTER